MSKLLREKTNLNMQSDYKRLDLDDRDETPSWGFNSTINPQFYLKWNKNGENKNLR